MNLAKLRLYSHQLAIETGRFKKVEKHNRFCFHGLNRIEDEFHFMLQCALYHHFRLKYIKEYFWKKPSMFKSIQLLLEVFKLYWNCQNSRCNLGNKYIKTSFLLRSKPVQLQSFYYLLHSPFVFIINY